MSVAEPRRRRRWPIALLIVVVVLAVLVGVLVVIGDGVARQQVSKVAGAQLAAELGVPASRVDVEPAPGLILPQLVTGRLDDVRVTANGVTVQGVTASFSSRLRGVAVDGSSVQSMTGALTVPASQFAALAARQNVKVDSVAPDPPDLVVTTSTSVLGISLPVGVRIRPSAAGGALVLTAQRVEVAGATIDADRLRSTPLGQYLEPQRICIAERLPAGLTLSSARVSGKALDLGFRGSDVALRGSAKGSCS